MRRLVMAAAAAFAGFMLCCSALQAQTAPVARAAPASGAPQTVSELGGQDLSALSVAWWRWLMSAPDGRDPLADDSGALCDLGQQGAIWYLAGSYESDKVTRRCAIPQGKYIFIPIADIMLWDSADGQDCSLLQGDVKTAMDTARGLYLEVDGEKADSAALHRAAARQCFTLPNETDIYASDGYWALLKPLAKGSHIIRFGNIIGDNGETAENSAQIIEYRLTVE